MKKIILTLVSVAMFACAFAQTDKDAVSMVSYEQSWLDCNGTIALKNNTEEEIHNVEFQITYLDMADNALDYEVFQKRVIIAPGMTKKIDIPAYEHNRYYHYYKTKDKFGNPSFKIKFELKGYNIDLSKNSEYSSYYSDFERDSEFENPYDSASHFIWLFVLLFFGIWIGLYVLVAIMAKKRKRNVVVWVLLSLVLTPLLTSLILLAIGNDDLARGNGIY